VGGNKEGGRVAGWQAGGQAGSGQAKVPPQCMPKIRRGQISTL
jgi:hypothetical protein